MSLRAVHDAGFAIIANVLRPNEVQQLSSELGQAVLVRSRAGARHILGNPIVASLAVDARLAAIAAEILGRPPVPFRATLFDKSATANWLVVWHQDTALPLKGRRDLPGWGPWSVKAGVLYAHAPAAALEQVVALRVHLDDSDHGNGPLRVLPTTHAMGVLSDAEIERLVAEIRPVDCLVGSGGIVAMRPLIVHSSSKSRSQSARRVLHIEYASTTAIGEQLEIARV